jgi:hypothetical protein
MKWSRGRAKKAADEKRGEGLTEINIQPLQAPGPPTFKLEYFSI